MAGAFSRNGRRVKILAPGGLNALETLLPLCIAPSHVPGRATQM